MEDLWRIQKSGVDIEDFADHAEYRRFLERFCDDEEQSNRRRLLYGDMEIGAPQRSSTKRRRSTKQTE